jgi:hypothetical protein
MWGVWSSLVAALTLTPACGPRLLCTVPVLYPSAIAAGRGAADANPIANTARTPPSASLRATALAARESQDWFMYCPLEWSI